MDDIKRRFEDLQSRQLTSKISLTNQTLEEIGVKNLLLRPYQLDGVGWLIERFHNGHGCILGDEMGLGKTCQTISLLVYLFENKLISKHILILSPLSVISNWQDEICRFAPGLKLLSYLGDKDSREDLRHKISKGQQPFNVLLTTYELFLKDDSFLKSYSWSVLVVDEGHRLKNPESLLRRTLCEFKLRHKILLTGTPVQNNLTELYSLLSFITPSVFHRAHEEAFTDHFQKQVDRGKDVSELHDLLKPFLLRRIKTEVLQDLPVKSEVILYHGISALQKKYYKVILTKDLEAFEQSGQSRTRLMNILMQLRKCVNHPYLFDGVEPEPFVIGDHLVEASGKLFLLDQMLALFKIQGHKVLIFSQMTRMLDILQDYLGYRGYSYERLDGSVRGEERFLAIKNFNKDDDTFVFLLSTRAGGQGLNLTSADTVIFVDSDFNPQNDLQAAARAHRIGQNRNVKVIRLIGRSTVEEIILRRAEAKLKLTNTVIEGGQFSGLGKETLIADSNLQLQDILKFGVDKLFENEDSSVSDVNFDLMLGSTVDGEWQLEEAPSSITHNEIQEETPEEMIDDRGTVPESMYVFEGTDYSKEAIKDTASTEDRKAFDDLLTAKKVTLMKAADEGRATRKENTFLLGMLPEASIHKPRKKLTPEQLAERKKKRAETAARHAKEEEEEEVRRAQERRRRREEKWTANNYTSCNILLDDEKEDDDDEDEESSEDDVDEDDNEDGDDDSRRNVINYISGDVTHPSVARDKNVFIVHCTDDSGHWGSGGVFSAISARSPQPEEQYELAGKMKDLVLGDAHLIAVDDVQSREQGKDYVSLIVAQHRDRHSCLSGIKLSALDEGLQRVYKAARKFKASVHLPRIGFKTAGFNWYGTERLIRKHLTSRGIETYIYYYPRRHAKRKMSPTTAENGKPNKLKVRRKKMSDISDSSDTEDEPVPIVTEKPCPVERLCDVFTGVSVYLHCLTPEHRKWYQRYIVAYNGDVDSFIQDSTTHIITGASTDTEKQDLKDLIDEHKHIVTVTSQWVDACLKKRKIMDTSKFLVASG